MNQPGIPAVTTVFPQLSPAKREREQSLESTVVKLAMSSSPGSINTRPKMEISEIFKKKT
jgi:hypothetical protein